MAAPVNSDESPVSVRSNVGNATGCIVAFGLLFLGIGLAVFTGLFIIPASQVLRARSWTPVPCVINGTQIRTHSGEDTTYSFEVAYTYTFNGSTYTGDRFRFGNNKNGNWNDKAAASAKYPVNSTATCFVDPSNPASSVLERGMTTDVWKGLFSLIFVAFGAGMSLIAWRSVNYLNKAKTEDWRPKVSNAGAIPQAQAAGRAVDAVRPSPFDSGPFSPIGVESSSPGAFDSRPVAPVSSGASGPITLKARSSPSGRLIGSLLVSVFWNGIVSVFLFQIGKEILRGQVGFFSLFMGLFLIPFVLIGAGLIIYFVGQVLALFNAKAVVTLSRASVAPGETLEVGWEFKNGAFFPKAVLVTLEAMEEATYQRGTDSVTDRATFFFVTLHDSEKENTTRSQASVSLPPDTMHSLEAKNNKITWLLKVRGTIKGWPDISEEYAVVVAPAGRR